MKNIHSTSAFFRFPLNGPLTHADDSIHPGSIPCISYYAALLIPVFFIFSACIAYGQPLLFQKKIENAPYFHLYPDGPGYLLTSLTGIARTDADLNILWRRTYGSAVSGTQFFPIAARPKTSGGYLLAGYGRQVSQAKFAIAFTDADASGAPLLPRLYTPSGLPVATETTMQLCLPTADGGFLCGGQIQNSGTGGPEWYVLKLNGNGGVQWSRGFRSGGEERLCDIRQLPDGSYIATFAIDDDVVLTRMDSNGQQQWGQRYHTGKMLFASVAYDPALGGYLVACGPATGNVNLLFRTDAVGNLLWSRSYGTLTPTSAGRFQSIHALPGGFLIGGTFVSSAPGVPQTQQSFLIKTTGDGAIDWSSLNSAGSDNRFVAALPVSGSGIVFSGAVPGQTNESRLARMSLQGVVPSCPGATVFFQQSTGGVVTATSIPANPLLATQVSFVQAATFNLPAQYAGAPPEVLYCQALGMDEETQTKSGLQVFPNPSTGLMEVQTPEEPWSGTGATFYLFDLTGKMLLWETLPPGSKPGLFSLDLSSFPPGCYLGRFMIGKKSFSAKLVKL